MIGRTQNQKQLSKSVLYAAAVTASVIGLAADMVRAGDVVRSSATGTLNLTTSWDGGVLPTASDVAVWAPTSAVSGQIGADTSWAGIRIGSTTGAVSINGANVLTLGASGIDMSAATQDLTLQPGPANTSGITLGAAQTWNIAAGRLLTAANSATAITGTGALTKSGDGTLTLGSGTSTFSGGLTVNAGTVRFGTNTVAASGAITSSPLGTGIVTMNGGTLAGSSASGRDISNDFNINSDFTVGLAGTVNTTSGAARIRMGGTLNLGGGTRNVTLTNGAPTLTNGTEQFAFIAQGGRNATVTNGEIRFVAGSGATATNPSVVALSTSGGVTFTSNAGLTLGNNVLLFTPNGQGLTGTTSPKVTLEAGSNLLLANATQTRSFVANSLSGSGTIGAYQTDGTTNAASITVDAATGTATFSGVIQNSTAIFANAGNTTVSFIKNNAGTQVLSGANTYTGTTAVNGGTLVVGAAQSIPQVSATTVGGAGAAVLKLGTTGQTILNSLTVAAGGRVDLGKGQLLLNNGGGATALAAVAAQVAAGRAGGDGFFSSDAVAGTSDIGFKDTGTGIYVRYTRTGDADLNGQVNFNDFLVLQNNFGNAGSFAEGDFDYSGTVNFNDFLVLQNNFGTSVTGAAVAVTASQVAAMQSFAAAVPEPTALAVVGVGAMAMLRRRRA